MPTLTAYGQLCAELRALGHTREEISQMSYEFLRGDFSKLSSMDAFQEIFSAREMELQTCRVQYDLFEVLFYNHRTLQEFLASYSETSRALKKISQRSFWEVVTNVFSYLLSQGGARPEVVLECIYDFFGDWAPILKTCRILEDS